jgi:hypothetical protein
VLNNSETDHDIETSLWKRRRVDIRLAEEIGPVRLAILAIGLNRTGKVDRDESPGELEKEFREPPRARPAFEHSFPLEGVEGVTQASLKSLAAIGAARIRVKLGLPVSLPLSPEGRRIAIMVNEPRDALADLESAILLTQQPPVPIPWKDGIYAKLSRPRQLSTVDRTAKATRNVPY